MDNGQETTYLEPPPMIQENQMEWDMAVEKVARVINDTCNDYDKKGHPYYSKYLREAFYHKIRELNNPHKVKLTKIGLK